MNRRSAIKALMLPLAGCASASAGVLSNVEPRQVGKPDSETLDERLRARGVADNDFYRRVFFTWTTTAQVTKLRATRRLLVATASSGTFVSPFNRSLATVGSGTQWGAAVARTLAGHPALIRRRYAWPSSFATVLGLGGYTYGSALLRIELSPDAWIGRFDPNAPEPFRFVDAFGIPIARHDVLAMPHRIGAIYHIRTNPAVAVPFREYVVTNPFMVSSWSVGTDEIHDELDRERAILRELGERSITPREASVAAHTAWTGSTTHGDTPTLWRAALAFDVERYHPSPDRLAGIADALDAYEPAGTPLDSRT